MNKKLLFIVILSSVLLYSCQETAPVSKYQQAIELGGLWFLNNQDQDFIHYQYNPYDRVHPDKGHSLREMGALWSIATLSNYLDNESYTRLAVRGFGHFQKHIIYDEFLDFCWVNVTPDSIKLGYPAFMILTLLEIEHPKKEFYLEKLANSIIFQQNYDGSLRTFLFSNRSTGVDYYPGEALVALMSLYEYTGDKRYVETAANAFPYYSKYFRGNPNTAFVPWQSRSGLKLYKATTDPEVAEFIFEMNDYMLKEHSTGDPCRNFNFHRGIVTAVYIEGVNQAYELADMLDDEQRKECYGNYIKEGSDFILTLQINEGYMPEAKGGFLGSNTSTSMRVDRNQHAVMALMDAMELGVFD